MKIIIIWNLQFVKVKTKMLAQISILQDLCSFKIKINSLELHLVYVLDI